MCLEVEQARVIDFAQPINQGVTQGFIFPRRKWFGVEGKSFC